MIAVNDNIELKATVTAVGGDNFTIGITQIFADSKWEIFKAEKPLIIQISDYDPKQLSPVELELYKAMLAKYSTTLTGDDAVTANSAKSKLA